MNPIISIIMPVKNNKKYIRNAINSVLSQTLSDWELIIVDGYSGDGTIDVIREYADLDPRIQMYELDAWIYASINYGIRVSNAPYFTVLNSDDLLDPDAIRVASEYINAYDLDLFLMGVSENLCDAEQNILKSTEEEVLRRFPVKFVLKDHDQVLRNWVNIYEGGLLGNQLNVYRKDTVKGHEFRNDVYGADNLFNIDVYPLMRSVGYAPRCLYKFMQYDGDKGNTSVGRYYPYMHSMFNEFYTGMQDQLRKYDLLSDYAEHVLRQRRIGEFYYEMYCLLRTENPMSFEDKIHNLNMFVDDVAPIFVKEQQIEKLRDYLKNLFRRL